MSYTWQCAYCSRVSERDFPQTSYFICQPCSKIGELKENERGDTTFEKYKKKDNL